MAHTPQQLRKRALICAVVGSLLGLTIVLLPVTLILWVVAIVYLKKAHEAEHGETPWWAKSFLQLYREYKERKRRREDEPPREIPHK